MLKAFSKWFRNTDERLLLLYTCIATVVASSTFGPLGMAIFGGLAFVLLMLIPKRGLDDV